MILLSRLNGTKIVLNADLIKYVETTPDTLITLLNGEKFMVRDSVDEVVGAATDYKKRVAQEPPVKPPANFEELIEKVNKAH